jgi:hypothetical protein
MLLPSRDLKQPREAVCHCRRGADFSAQLHKLVDHDGSSVQIPLLFGAVAKNDAFGAVPEAGGEGG